MFPRNETLERISSQSSQASRNSILTRRSYKRLYPPSIKVEEINANEVQETLGFMASITWCRTT